MKINKSIRKHYAALVEAWTQLQRLVKHPYNTISGVLILYPVGEAPLQAPLQDGAALLEGCTRQFRKYFIEEINA